MKTKAKRKLAARQTLDKGAKKKFQYRVTVEFGPDEKKKYGNAGEMLAYLRKNAKSGSDFSRAVMGHLAEHLAGAIKAGLDPRKRAKDPTILTYWGCSGMPDYCQNCYQLCQDGNNLWCSYCC